MRLLTGCFGVEPLSKQDAYEPADAPLTSKRFSLFNDAAKETLTNYGYLCRSPVVDVLTHDQLVALASIPTTVAYKTNQVLYRTGEEVGSRQLFFLVKGACKVSKRVETYESASTVRRSTMSHDANTGTLPRGSASNNLNARGTKPPSIRYRPSLNSTPPARWVDDDSSPRGDSEEQTTEIVLRRIEPKQWFGFCALLDLKTRLASVTALEHTVCLVFDELRLKQFFDAHPGTASVIGNQIVGQGVWAVLRATALFTNLTSSAAALLCSLFQPRHIPAKTVIFAESDPPDEGVSLFVMVQGSAVMYQTMTTGQQAVVRVIENADLFGEACCLFSLPRIATVKTNRDCIVMELPQQALNKFLKYSPEIKVNLRAAYNNSTVATHHLLNNEIIAEYFIQFCETEHSTENMDFWREAKEFRLAPARRKDFLVVDAHRLCNTYIGDNAQKQVNLLGSTQEKITHAIQHGIINSLTFQEAEDEILHLMDRDSFSRFKNSELYQECLQRCRKIKTTW